MDRRWDYNGVRDRNNPEDIMIVIIETMTGNGSETFPDATFPINTRAQIMKAGLSLDEITRRRRRHYSFSTTRAYVEIDGERVYITEPLHWAAGQIRMNNQAHERDAYPITAELLIDEGRRLMQEAEA